MTGSEILNTTSTLSITEISTIVIALSAFILTMWQVFLSKKHNLLSIQPAVCSSSTYNYDGFSSEIINKGAGVAIVDIFQFYIHGSEVTFKEFQADIRDLVKDYEHTLSDFTLKPGSFIAAGEKFNVFDMQFENNVDKKFISSFRQRYSLFIEYHCLYGRKFSYKKTW